MPATLPSLKIDAESELRKRFLPHQITWILDDSQMRLAGKPIRVGCTCADAFKNVRKRLASLLALYRRFPLPAAVPSEHEPLSSLFFFCR